MDILSKEARSELMSRVKSRGTKPEALLGAALKAAGLRPSRSSGAVFGRPDFVFKAAKLAIFVDGCFWHGCPQHSRAPKDDPESYWSGKLSKNGLRDEAVMQELLGKGWMAMRIWEHDLKTQAMATEHASRIKEAREARLL
jgi:DNA mismatch endonuclease (patch repair protein)